MKKQTLLYIPVVLMAVFIFSALGMHLSNAAPMFNKFARDFDFTFLTNGTVQKMTPEAEAANLKLNDRLIAINGRVMESQLVYLEELSKLEGGKSANITVERKNAEGQTERIEQSVMPVRVEKNFSFYLGLFVGFLWNYGIPSFCALLGLWVVAVRPRDYLAWLLLFLLLGVASNSLEGYPPTSLVGLFRNIFFSSWSLAMLLFGIYFPERWSVDKKIPWAKWIFIAPLLFQLLLTFLSQLKIFFGIGLINYLGFIASPYTKVAAFINMLAIGVFFAALGHKSGTLENPDARRRMKLTVYGTSVAMMPAFAIILYAIYLGRANAFFQVVPQWIALLALSLIFLFPLTLAYVIVVERAMDVSVVVRQGLQYALAKNGVFILQIILSIAVGLTAFSFASETTTNRPQKIVFIALGVMSIFLIRLLADKIKTWIDRKFFREAYNTEQILTELSEEVRTMVETKPLLEIVSSKISESLHVPQIALLLKNGTGFYPAHALGYETIPAVELKETDKTIEKLKANQPLAVYQDDEDSWVNEEIGADEKENLQKLNSQLLLPISAKNEVSGVISLSPKLSEEPFTPNDLRLLKSVASQTGLALENSRLTEAIVSETAQRERLNREVEIAREVQERLFPQELPKIEGLDYYGACRPALGVGGDYYDFLELPENKFGIAIGDISGKGIGASLMMASLQASLRGQTIHFKDELGDMMKQINGLLYEASTSNRYATFFYSQYDPQTRKLIFVNAGHNPPVLLRPTNESKTEFEIIKLEDGGAVVGMLPSMLVFYKQGEIELQSGDLIVGSTDGITEAMNPQEEEWSEEAMIEELKKIYEKSSEEILNHIVAKADEFANGAKQHDDMTMVVIKVI